MKDSSGAAVERMTKLLGNVLAATDLGPPHFNELVGETPANMSDWSPQYRRR